MALSMYLLIFGVISILGITGLILFFISKHKKTVKQTHKRTPMQKKLIDMAKTDLLASIKPEGTNASKIATIKALDELE